MSFYFNCEFCNAKIEAEESWIGKQAECPICKNFITITQNIKHETIQQEETFLFKCSECGSIKPLNITLLNKKIECPCCAEEVIAEKALTKTCLNCGNQIKINATVCKFCKKSIDTPNIYTNKEFSNKTDYKPISLKSNFLDIMFFAWWLSMAILYPLGIIFSCLSENSIIFALMSIPTTVFFFILIFNYWRIALQKLQSNSFYINFDLRNITPGKAVGFCFIPFFNLYWIFIAFDKLGNILKHISQNNKNLFSFGFSISLCFTFIFAFFISVLSNIISGDSIIETIYFIFLICYIGICIWNTIYYILMTCAFHKTIKRITK